MTVTAISRLYAQANQQFTVIAEEKEIGAIEPFCQAFGKRSEVTAG